MKINDKNYNLNKHANELSREEVAGKNQAFLNIFDALDKADGKADKKINKKNLIIIFNSIIEIDQKSETGKGVFSDSELKQLQKKLLPDLNVTFENFKKFITSLLDKNEYRYINSSLGSKKSDIRTIDAKNVSIRESSRRKPMTKNSKTQPINEQINAFKQGNIGDCYLLAEINAIKNTQGGKELFKKNITRLKDGGVIIHLPGALKVKNDLIKSYPNKKNYIEITGEYYITPEAIDRAWMLSGDTYSEGDMDVILYELAFEAYRMEMAKTSKALGIKQNDPQKITAEGNANSSTSSVLSSGHTYDAGFILTGKTSDVYRASKAKYKNPKLYKNGEFGFISKEEMERRCSYTRKGTQEIHNLTTSEKSLHEKLCNYSNKERDYALTCYVRVAKNGPDGSTKAGGGHAMTVLRITNDTVYVLNPWYKNTNNNKCIEPIPIDEFEKMSTGFIAHKIERNATLEMASSGNKLQRIANKLN